MKQIENLRAALLCLIFSCLVQGAAAQGNLDGEWDGVVEFLEPVKITLSFSQDMGRPKVEVIDAAGLRTPGAGVQVREGTVRFVAVVKNRLLFQGALSANGKTLSGRVKGLGPDSQIDTEWRATRRAEGVAAPAVKSHYETAKARETSVTEEESLAAINALNRVLGADPKNVDAYLARGVTYANWASWTVAFEDDFAKVVRLMDSAIGDFGKAVELAPNDYRGYFERGYAQRLKATYGGPGVDSLKCVEAALVDFNAALKLKPGDAESAAQRTQAEARIQQLKAFKK